MSEATAFMLNGTPVRASSAPSRRLSEVLRGEFRLMGTKVGCDAGDCGACTVLVGGEVACACLVPLAQVEGTAVVTVEGLSGNTRMGRALQESFLANAAAQCGICTPGMLASAAALLERSSSPDETEIADALGGVLCRCTGYRKIIAAVRSASQEIAADPHPAGGSAVGCRVPRLDGRPKVEGSERFGADGVPSGALEVHAIRSPHHRARFRLGDTEAWRAAHPGIVRILTASDIPGRNLHGVLAPFADQPVFAVGEARFRGEAIAAVVCEPGMSVDRATFPVEWEELPPLLAMEEAVFPGAPPLHDARSGNVLIRGHVSRGDVAGGLQSAAATVEGTFETGYVEHAYVEPEAGWARRVGDRIEVTVSTQSPYLDRDDTAAILGIAPANVRIIPSACGGGFGSKLDLSVQPYVALAAWFTGRPASMVYTRPESMAATTKRHPARMRSRMAADGEGRLVAMEFDADFNTGAYASWGPTVANRVPVHASGPYVVPNYRADTRAILTHAVPSGAFRGFGVPQTVIAQEQLLDMLADRLGLDPLEFRIANALTSSDATVTGQVLGDGVGFRACLEVLREQWFTANQEAAHHNARATATRRGAGVAGMFYGCGNTSLPNPSTIRMGLTATGRLSLHQGAVDIGQGSNTVIAQIAADAVGVPLDLVDLVPPDTDLTPDCGKTSASRQTFVTGKAAEIAGRALRQQVLRLANAGEAARIEVAGAILTVHEGALRRTVNLAHQRPDARGYVLSAEETFDPATTPLDARGQGSPYQVYGFGAHLAEVEVNLALGTVRVLRVTAAHDVGRAINPQLVEGQIEGGIAQGIGMALMEEFTPGRGENLHDYLIPTIGDVPEIHSILVECTASAGPFGAKGIGEQALIPTAPAILNAIARATGARLYRTPATPDRIRAALLSLKSDGSRP
jgi:aldehyde oxidoreductase